jgi:hypothetical protein
MAISFLKKLSTAVPSGSLKYLLHNHLAGPEDGRPYANIHASELTKPEGLCPRLYALADVTKAKPKNEWLSTSDQVTFRIGRELQDATVNWFADMGKAIGHWKCSACGALHEFQLRPAKCGTCHSRHFHPKEVRFKSEINGASCGVDMLVAMGDTKLVPVELKTMDKDLFKGLVAPLAEHRLRTNLYLRIIKESAHVWSKQVDVSRAIVFYISKGGFGCADPQLKAWGLYDGFSPFKEYEVKRADKETDYLSARAKVVTDFRAGKIGMPTGLCSTAMSKRAQGCNLKGVCFGGDHPPAHEWKVAGE